VWGGGTFMPASMVQTDGIVIDRSTIGELGAFTNNGATTGPAGWWISNAALYDSYGPWVGNLAIGALGYNVGSMGGLNGVTNVGVTESKISAVEWDGIHMMRNVSGYCSRFVFEWAQSFENNENYWNVNAACPVVVMSPGLQTNATTYSSANATQISYVAWANDETFGLSSGTLTGSGGSGYVYADVLSITGGSLGITSQPTVGAGGSGYVVGDVLTITGGTCSSQPTVTVLSVSSGVITALTVNNQGACTVNPTSPNSATGGTGTGASVVFTMDSPAYLVANGVSIANPTVSGGGSGGTGYSVNDVLTITGGTCSAQPTVKVTSVSSGVITGLTVNNGGTCTVNPTSPNTVTGGTGSGAHVVFTAGVITSLYPSNSVGAPGSPSGAYTIVPSSPNTVTGGHGSGLSTVTLAFSPQGNCQQAGSNCIKMAVNMTTPNTVSANNLIGSASFPELCFVTGPQVQGSGRSPLTGNGNIDGNCLYMNQQGGPGGTAATLDSSNASQYFIWVPPSVLVNSCSYPSLTNCPAVGNQFFLGINQHQDSLENYSNCNPANFNSCTYNWFGQRVAVSSISGDFLISGNSASDYNGTGVGITVTGSSFTLAGAPAHKLLPGNFITIGQTISGSPSAQPRMILTMASNGLSGTLTGPYTGQAYGPFTRFAYSQPYGNSSISNPFYVRNLLPPLTGVTQNQTINILADVIALTASGVGNQILHATVCESAGSANGGVGMAYDCKNTPVELTFFGQNGCNPCGTTNVAGQTTSTTPALGTDRVPFTATVNNPSLLINIDGQGFSSEYGATYVTGLTAYIITPNPSAECTTMATCSLTATPVTGGNAQIPYALADIQWSPNNGNVNTGSNADYYYSTAFHDWMCQLCVLYVNPYSQSTQWASGVDNFCYCQSTLIGSQYIIFRDNLYPSYYNFASSNGNNFAAYNSQLRNSIVSSYQFASGFQSDGINGLNNTFQVSPIMATLPVLNTGITFSGANLCPFTGTAPPGLTSCSTVMDWHPTGNTQALANSAYTGCAIDSLFDFKTNPITCGAGKVGAEQ
jgi:hypothetical protein